MNLYDAVVESLGPLVGRPVVEICVRSVAMKRGKSAETLNGDDVEALMERVRHDMSPFTSKPLLEAAITQVRMKAGC